MVGEICPKIEFKRSSRFTNRHGRATHSRILSKSPSKEITTKPYENLWFSDDFKGNRNKKFAEIRLIIEAKFGDDLKNVMKAFERPSSQQF